MVEESHVQACRNCLVYDPTSGLLTWVSVNNQHRGKRAGTLYRDKNGKRYIRVIVRGRYVFAHQVAWFLHFGEWCPGELDHINGDGTDNRLVNLRRVGPGLNMLNKRLMSNNTSGCCGVTYRKREKRWEARININGKRHVLGLFATYEAAAEARGQANLEFNFHKNHGTERPL